MKLYFLKFASFCATLLTWIIPNFHKKINGIKTKRNLMYKDENCNRYNKFDVYYEEKNTNNSKKPVIVYIHGGGWALYTKEIYTTQSRKFAKMGSVVFCCNHSLSPKYKMDTIMDDVYHAIKRARELAPTFGGDPDNIILAGDSSGAHIAMLASVFAKDQIDGYTKEISDAIKGLILFYGVYDFSTAIESKFVNMKTYAHACLPGKIGTEEHTFAMKHYSPLSHDLTGIPKTFIVSGKIDRLHETQSHELVRRLDECGESSKKVFFSKKNIKAMHAFMIFDDISTTTRVHRELEQFIKESNR